MSKVILTLEDAADEQVSLLCTHVDGFNSASPAHKLSSVIIKFLEDEAVEKVETPFVDASNQDTAGNTIDTAGNTIIYAR